MSRSSPVTETAHIKIDHPARPAEADYEYTDLIRRIETMGGERVVVAILQQYAFAAPSNGSYAGSLWAIAEWLNERLSSAHAQTPDQWQPIETAPRDGTRILATGGGLESTIEIVVYNERVGSWDTPHYTLDDRDDEAEGYNRPKLWQPLPALSDTSTVRTCDHDWNIWPETDGHSQRCMKCGAYRDTPTSSPERK